MPKAIAIDEFKGDIGKEKYQLIIADSVTREPINILPNRLWLARTCGQLSLYTLYELGPGQGKGAGT